MCICDEKPALARGAFSPSIHRRNMKASERKRGRHCIVNAPLKIVETFFQASAIRVMNSEINCMRD
jgi:hypothetical protein